MDFLNLTPHDIRIIKADVTFSKRQGVNYLKSGYSPNDPTINQIEPIPHSLKPMTVTDTALELPQYSPVQLFSPASSAQLANYVDTLELERHEIIIVSQKCATWINGNVALHAGPNQTLNYLSDPVLLDKFYIPYNQVYYKGKVIGVLGLQKVTPYSINGLITYADAIQKGRKVSLHALLYYCYQYVNLPVNNRLFATRQDGGRQEGALRVANDYLCKHGYNTFQTLQDLTGLRGTPITSQNFPTSFFG